MILQGLQVEAHNLSGWIDRTDRRDKSLFRLSLDWLRHGLKREWDFEPLFWFQKALYAAKQAGRDRTVIFDTNSTGRGNNLPKWRRGDARPGSDAPVGRGR